MKVGLVLGAGGTVGLAYHAGVLRALEEEAGFVPDSADLLVGTSAGSVIAAYLRSGWSTSDLWQVVLAEAGELPPGPSGHPPGGAGLPNLFATAFETPVDLLRRALGSTFVLSRSMLRMPLPALPAPLRRAFPGGIFQMAEGRRRFEQELPAEWPDRPTWLCAVDIVSGRRVVLGRRHPPRLPLPKAVLASCAIPGVYPPVRYGRRELIDGGAHSTTNLDLAARDGCELVIGIAPMGFDPAHPPHVLGQLTRRLANRQLAVELAYARRKGTELLVIRPTASEVRVQGLNLMRAGGLMTVASAAREATARLLGTADARAVLEGLAA